MRVWLYISTNLAFVVAQMRSYLKLQGYGKRKHAFKTTHSFRLTRKELLYVRMKPAVHKAASGG